MNPQYLRFTSARLANLAYALHVVYMEQDDPRSDFALGVQAEIDRINAILERRARDRRRGAHDGCQVCTPPAAQ